MTPFMPILSKNGIRGVFIMKNFSGYHRSKSYFEGWYCKIQTNKENMAFIPAYHIDNKGNRSASLQIIFDSNTYYYTFSSLQFFAASDRFAVYLDKSKFWDMGMHLDIEKPNLRLQADIHYGNLCKVNQDIMGPFSLFQNLECNHGVISMGHTVNGIIIINGKTKIIHGMGYLEKDWGSSFPDTYFWTQCLFKNIGRGSIMVSIADIPIKTRIKNNKIFKFKGCICQICHRKKQYRMATYLGCKIVKYNESEIIIKQGKKKLIISLYPQIRSKDENINGALRAPINGNMQRIIYESISTRVRYQFYINESCIFDILNEKAGVELIK